MWYESTMNYAQDATWIKDKPCTTCDMNQQQIVHNELTMNCVQHATQINDKSQQTV